MLDHIMAAMLAVTAPASEPPPATVSLQALFDEASTALEAGRYQEAVDAFQSLEQRPSVRRNPTVHGTLLMRLGRGMAVLDRDAEAEKALQEGLKLTPIDNGDLRTDRFLAEQAMGSIELRRLNHAAATERFKQALAFADQPVTRARAYVSLARSTMFDPGNDALTYIDQAIALTPGTRSPSKEESAAGAVMQTVRARVLINQSRFAEAYDTLRHAVAAQGGLDLRVSINEIITRSDLAIAAILAGHEDDARKYLAYTGAGRFEKSPFETAVSMQPPPCGGPAGLRPEDVAVVEFSVRSDGTVQSPTPIYASVKGAAAAEFAKAVADWAWRPEDAVKIPDFFRLVTRVQLSCSTSSERPPADGLLNAELAQWLTTVNAQDQELTGNPATDLGRLRTRLANLRPAEAPAALLPALIALGDNLAAPVDERRAALAEARGVALRSGAPIAAQIMIEIRLAMLSALGPDYRSRQVRNDLRALLARPDVAANPLVAGTLKLLLTDPMWRSPPPQDAPALLTEVANDNRLEPRHPLRVGALIRLATVQAASGNRVAAAENFRLTGLSAQQCALIDAKPAVLRTNVSRADFPTEALRWGFEGWVQTEYDIMPDGRTASQRAIVAYPPFVFRDAALQVARGVNYTKSYRPDGSAACGGEQQTINFRIPG